MKVAQALAYRHNNHATLGHDLALIGAARGLDSGLGGGSGWGGQASADRHHHVRALALPACLLPACLPFAEGRTETGRTERRRRKPSLSRHRTPSAVEHPNMMDRTRADQKPNSVFAAFFFPVLRRLHLHLFDLHLAVSLPSAAWPLRRESVMGVRIQGKSTEKNKGPWTSWLADTQLGHRMSREPRVGPERVLWPSDSEDAEERRLARFWSAT